MPANPRTGVIIMTYGSASTAENVSGYMHQIYGNKASQETIADFENRYRLVGGSPLVQITAQQAALLQSQLGESFVVRSGMLHSEPTIEQAVGECKATGAASLIGVILSPQYSSFIMAGYKSALISAALSHGFTEKDVKIAQPWPTETNFINLLSRRIQDALGRLKPRYGHQIPIIFTTHSLPERVVANDPSYLEQLQRTTDSVLAQLNDPTLTHFSAYQSAGHTPEPWLQPDLVDILAKLRQMDSPAVLIVPIQFLSDHLEILFDLDIAARGQCEEYGISYHRIALPNTSPEFISTLKSIVHSAAVS